jgi:hypothetical protein
MLTTGISAKTVVPSLQIHRPTTQGIFVLIHKADVGDLIRLIPKQALWLVSLWRNQPWLC